MCNIGNRDPPNADPLRSGRHAPGGRRVKGEPLRPACSPLQRAYNITTRDTGVPQANHAVSEAHLSRIIKVDLGEELFSYHIDDKAKRLAEMMDGKLLLVTNAEGLPAQNVIQRYKSLADIERGFKVLKSEIEIGPVYHRLPERIRAHASNCFMALILHRVMRSRLKAADACYTPEQALEQLQHTLHHRVRLNGGEPVTGVSTISTEQNEVLHALGIGKPAAPAQLALL